MEAQDWATIAATFIALVALVLSGYNTFSQRRERQEKRRRHLRVRGGVIASGANSPERHSLEIEITNESPEVEVTVVDISTRIPKAPPGTIDSWSYQNVVQGDRELPCKLSPGDRVEFSLPWEHVSNSVKTPDEDGWVRVPIEVEDSLDGVYVSEVSYREYTPPPDDEDQ